MTHSSLKTHRSISYDKKKNPLVWLGLAWFFIGSSPSCFGFEKMDSGYQISYGNPEAPIHVTEYISLSCPQCIRLIRQELPKWKNTYIASGEVFWSFHFDPADVLTLQALVCLSKLSGEEKPLFFEAVVQNMDDPALGCRLMQAAMEVFEKPIAELESLEFLEKTEAFSKAFQFVSQPDAPTVIPCIEINGKIYSEFPHPLFLEKTLQSHISE